MKYSHKNKFRVCIYFLELIFTSLKKLNIKLNKLKHSYNYV